MMNKLRNIKDPLGLMLFIAFERWYTRNGNRVLSTNMYRKVSKKYNLIKYMKYRELRQRFFINFTTELSSKYKIDDEFMMDGWSRPESHDLPHSKEMLEKAKEIFELKGPHHNTRCNPYPVYTAEELISIDVFRNFALSEKLLYMAAKYLGEYPILNNIDILRSDPSHRKSDWQGSQLFHLDIIDRKILRVIIYITDVDSESGPFTFIPLAASNAIRYDKALGYGKMFKPVSVSDEQVANCLGDMNDLIEVEGMSGDILLIDTSNCFHCGSRNYSKVRGAIMITYASLAKENLRSSLGLDPEFDIAESDEEFIKFAKSRNYYPS